MGVPLSIRIDDEIRAELEAQASARGIGLSTLIRDLAIDAARSARRARIHAASQRVGRQVAAHPQAEAFYQDWGAPNADGG